MGNGRGQLDVPHPLTTNLGASDLDAAALADDALEPNALVLTAGALPVPGRAEDLLAEEPVLFRLEGAVVDGFRLLDLAVGPRADVVRGGETDTQLVEEVDVKHWWHVPVCSVIQAIRNALTATVSRRRTRGGRLENRGRGGSGGARGRWVPPLPSPSPGVFLASSPSRRPRPTHCATG